MRLIDADALKEQMYHEAFETDTDMQKWESGCWIRYKMFENAIAAAPTIDPVKHGRWVCGCCSQCGFVLHSTGLTNYCPNCGASMGRSEL